MTRAAMCLAALTLALSPVGCGSNNPESETASTGGVNGASGTGGAGGATGGSIAQAPELEAGTGGSTSQHDDGTGGGTSQHDDGDTNALDAPATPDELLAFLMRGDYSAWPSEMSHASSGPHAGPVRVFYSPRAARALNANKLPFPFGAATVKELGEGASSGWAVWVKIDSESQAGKGFYWYEILRSGGQSRAAQGVGITGCTGCHSAGKDFLLSTEPFE